MVTTGSAEETKELGERIGAVLRPNDLIALQGELGSGKTTLAQGIAAGLGISDPVTSPTFIIINEYLGRLPLFHIDLYRLSIPEEAAELGIEEYFEQNGVCLIEWPERLDKLLPPTAEKIRLEIKNDQERTIWLSSGLAARLK